VAGAAPDDDLEVGPWKIPSAELEWRFSTSGGPGGQHANRSNTRADLIFDLSTSEVFPAEVHRLLTERLGSDPIVVSVADSRSQFRNRMLARARMRDLLVEAMKETRRRRPTKPTKTSKRKRLDDKRARSEKKQLRRQPPVD
jgi:ribosome-associated protein